MISACNTVCVLAPHIEFLNRHKDSVIAPIKSRNQKLGWIGACVVGHGIVFIAVLSLSA